MIITTRIGNGSVWAMVLLAISLQLRAALRLLRRYSTTKVLQVPQFPRCEMLQYCVTGDHGFAEPPGQHKILARKLVVRVCVAFPVGWRDLDILETAYYICQ